MEAPSFGTRVRERRLEEGLSQDELAQKAGISRNYLSEIERGQATNLSWQVVQRLSEALGLREEGGLDAGVSLANLPVGLREFAQSANLPPDDQLMLARVQLRGRRPTTADQWRLLYNFIKMIVQDDQAPNEG